MMRICIWIPRKESGGGEIRKISVEEVCMPVGPIIPIGGYIDPPEPETIFHPKHLGITIDGKEIPISNDLRVLSSISSLALHLQDERLREAINNGLRATSEIVNKDLPEGLSACYANFEEDISQSRDCK